MSDLIARIDGPLFRQQRRLLLDIAGMDAEEVFDPTPAQRDLLDGLVNLTDAIADEAHDAHGIDCLLTEDE